jgi:recombination protein RecA
MFEAAPGAPREELVLPWGIEALDALLPEGGLPRGAVVEMAVHGAAALATTLALKACRSAQQRGAWCGFVDPSETLHAPGAGGLGVALDRLIVVRPPLEMLARVTLRMAESRALSLVVVDAMGTPEQPLDVHLGPWVRVVRRLTQALQGTGSSVLLLTDKSAPRPLALPVTQRLELHRKNERELLLAVTRDLRGRLLPPRPLAVADLLERPREAGPGLSTSKPRRMAGAA